MPISRTRNRVLSAKAKSKTLWIMLPFPASRVFDKYLRQMMIFYFCLCGLWNLQVSSRKTVNSNNKCVQYKVYLLITWSLGAPLGPDVLVAALRACLTSSFTPFGRSGHVTHAMVQWWDSALEKSKKITDKLKIQEIQNFTKNSNFSKTPKLLWERGEGEDEELAILVVG